MNSTVFLLHVKIYIILLYINILNKMTGILAKSINNQSPDTKPYQMLWLNLNYA